ncbi:hypothetical protein AMJ87_04100 [candidate division WOR_3 bacterium SM23_60]|uniref:Uncharacterized protein n=1 Tax=candidate division WOR_3 bacterium SM23_60 TaxID=1703780 RepID=A0A0S8GJU2_UNCW3|nr:MAG: hypothetical protein AMJ87_04100 [candidate division WOR_3 bacterium SM23_60]
MRFRVFLTKPDYEAVTLFHLVSSQISSVTRGDIEPAISREQPLNVERDKLTISMCVVARLSAYEHSQGTVKAVLGI